MSKVTLLSAKKLLYRLQYCPIKLLRRHQRLDNRIKKCSSIRDIKKILQKYQYREPLCLLLECFGNHCPLNRVKYPERRNNLIQAIRRHQQQFTGTQLRYISWGSGALLQDCILLTHLILSHRLLYLEIHCIDRSYANLTMPIDNKLTTEPALFTLQARCTQFTAWICSAFPTLNVNVHWHVDSASYALYRQRHFIPSMPELFTVVDVDRSDELFHDLSLMPTHGLQTIIHLAPDNPETVTLTTRSNARNQPQQEIFALPKDTVLFRNKTGYHGRLLCKLPKKVYRKL